MCYHCEAKKGKKEVRDAPKATRVEEQFGYGKATAGRRRAPCELHYNRDAAEPERTAVQAALREHQGLQVVYGDGGPRTVEALARLQTARQARDEAQPTRVAASQAKSLRSNLQAKGRALAIAETAVVEAGRQRGEARRKHQLAVADVERLRAEVDEATQQANAASIGLSTVTARQALTATVGLLPPDQGADDAAGDDAPPQPHVQQITRVVKPAQAATQ